MRVWGAGKVRWFKIGGVVITFAIGWCGRYHIDTAFLSTKGFSPDHGMFESSAPTYRIKQIMSQQSSKVVLMVDHTKFNQRALFNVLSVEQIDTVISDQGISESDQDMLKNNVKNVYIVSSISFP